MAQSWSMTIAWPCESRKVPRNAPVWGSNALMRPSGTLLAISKVLLNGPKSAGAIARPPRRMQRAGDAHENVASGVKFVHEAGGRFVAAKGHPEVAPDVLNAVRGKAALDRGVGKRIHQVEVLVENVDAAVGAVVGGEKKVTRGVAGDCQTCVDGTVLRPARSDLGISRVDSRTPTTDGAVQSRE